MDEDLRALERAFAEAQDAMSYYRLTRGQVRAGIIHTVLVMGSYQSSVAIARKHRQAYPIQFQVVTGPQHILGRDPASTRYTMAHDFWTACPEAWDYIRSHGIKYFPLDPEDYPDRNRDYYSRFRRV